MSLREKNIDSIKKKRRKLSVDVGRNVQKSKMKDENNQTIRKESTDEFYSKRQTLLNILKHLDGILRKYKAEERSSFHIFTKVSEILNKYQIYSDETSENKFLSKVRWMKEYITRLDDQQQLSTFEKALNEVGELLLKEDLKRLAIHNENNNQGHLALGSSHTTEYLENIRIYLYDDTSKNFMVSVNDTVSELMQRVIGKISCLAKDLNDGFSIWEVPHHTEHGLRKLLNSELPVVIKRSWRRPSKFYFLTKKEEMIKFPDQSDLIISGGRRKSTQSTIIKPSGLPVKVYLNDSFKSFLIQKEEDCKSFKKRVVSKFNSAKKSYKFNNSLGLSNSNNSLTNPTFSRLESMPRSNSSPAPRNFDSAETLIDFPEDLNLFIIDESDNITEIQEDTDIHKCIESITHEYKIVLRKKTSSQFNKITKEKDQISLESRLSEEFLKLKEGNRKKINFVGLSLDHFPEELKDFNLNPLSLDISNNSINILPDWIESYSKVKIVNLSSNRFESIPIQLTKMISLQILDLCQNNIKQFDKEFFSMTQLKSLYINYNEFELIPEDFSKFSSLMELTLSGNKFTDDSMDALMHLSSLKMLDISSNELSSIPRFIHNLKNLEELYLSNNSITGLDQDIYNLIKLRSLDLSQNNIVTIPKGIDRLANLQELLMDGNPIISSPIDELESMDQLSIIKIPNLDDLLITRKNMRMDRRLSNNRSTANASIVDILMEKNDMNAEYTLEKKRSKDILLIKKSSSFPDGDFIFNVEDQNDNGGERKVTNKTGPNKRKKFSQKKFPTEPEIKFPCESDYIINPDADGYHVELEREMGISIEQLFTPLNLKFNDNQDDYFTNFHGLSHINFLAIEKNYGPTIISVLMVKELYKEELQHRVLIKNKNGDETLWLSFKNMNSHKKSKYALYTKIFSSIKKKLEDKYNFLSARLIEDNDFIDDILDYESRMSSNAFKFGVIYAGKEKTENGMYGIKDGSKDFQDFINYLGEKVRLKGWKNYSAGLDVENDRTGKWSLYQRWSTMEIMFHVSTLLPHDKDDEQHIERKKHIGNDIVVIVFQDEHADQFDPSIMRSWFNHVFVVIRPLKSEDGTVKYRMSIANKDGVYDHTPYLPRPAIFEKTPQFRKLLLTKLVNAERASYHAPGFGKALGNAREQLLSEMAKKCLGPERKGKTKKLKL